MRAAVRAPATATNPTLIETVAEIDASRRRPRWPRRRHWSAAGRRERRQVACRGRRRCLRRERFDTIAVMADEAVKVAREGDPEVSEAIDFAKYYGSVGLDVLEQQRAEGAELQPRGVVVVASPWNFPYAIPAGGVLAALAAGNAVILKPPPEARAHGAAPRRAVASWRRAAARSCSSSPAPTTRSASG